MSRSPTFSPPPPSPRRPGQLGRLLDRLERVQHAYDELPASHPAKIATRTYSLALSFSLVPALGSQVLSGKLRPSPKLRAAVARELSVTGFPFAMAVAFGGGAALEKWWAKNEPLSTTSRDTMVAYALSSALALGLVDMRNKAWTHGIAAAPPGRKPGAPARTSPTLDFTLLLLVRALDSVVQGWIRRQTTGPGKLTDYAQRIKWFDAQLDGLLFWLCSSRYDTRSSRITLSHYFLVLCGRSSTHRSGCPGPMSSGQSSSRKTESSLT